MEVATCSPTLRHSGLEDRGSCPVKGQLLELLGRDVAQGAVASDGIVVQAPRLDRLERLAKTHEPVLVQTRVRIPLGPPPDTCPCYPDSAERDRALSMVSSQGASDRCDYWRLRSLVRDHR